MTDATESQTDVLIVGAGPVGLTLGCELARRGIAYRLIDEKAEPATTSRALGTLPRTQEVFHLMGIAESALTPSVRTVGISFFDQDHLLFQATVGQVGTATTLVMPQTATERVLRDVLARHGGAVERGTALVDFRQDGDAVVASLRRGDGVQRVRSRYLIGCDGAHSTVRDVLGVPFVGVTYDDRFLLGDVRLSWDREHDQAYVWLHEDGMFAVMPLPGGDRWRLFVDLSSAPGDELPEPSIETFQGLLRVRTGDAATVVSDPIWLSEFRVHRRMVDRYRVGRVFLAGDAAHIHSPFGGQGMNTGIQDAFNLGWKLALAVRGRAAPALLDTYGEERIPVARDVLAGTDQVTKLLLARNAALRFVRDQVVARLLELDFVQAMLWERGSDLRFDYRQSSLSATDEDSLTHTRLLPDRRTETPSLGDRYDFATAPRAGDRAPPGNALSGPARTPTTLFDEFARGPFTLLLFDGRAQTAAGYARLTAIARRAKDALGDDVQTFVVVHGDARPATLDRDGPLLLDPDGELHDRYGAGAEALYLIRPDGYAGYRAQPARQDTLLAYLARVFLMAPRPSR